MEFVAKTVCVLRGTESEVRSLGIILGQSYPAAFPLATLQTSIGLESTIKKSSSPSILQASLLRISSHSPAVFFLRSLNCLREIRLGNLALYPCSLYSKSHFSLSILSTSAANDSATISKSEYLGIGPRRGMLPCSFTRLFENCLHIPRILTNFVYTMI